MDEIRRLEFQIRELQRELQRQNSEAARLRQNLADENLRKLQAYQAEMGTNLDRHDKNVQREYERLLQEYQRSTNEEIQEQQLKMNTEYQKLLVSMQQKEQEWMEKSRQLEALITELKKNTLEKDQVSAQEADKYMIEAALTYKDIEKKPHEKFFPKRLLNFYNAIREARTLFKSGLNEAAIAISISAKSGLNRLGYEVDEQYEEWKRQYFIFKNKVGLLHMKLSDELLIWKKFSTNQNSSSLNAEEKNTCLIEVNFWAKGEYGKLSNRLAEFGREISKTESMGIDNYLKDENSMDSDELKRYIDELDQMSKTFDDISEAYKERYSASCQRADWGELMIDFLEDEINLTWIESDSHFKLIEEEGKEFISYMKSKYGELYEKTDIRELLELAFDNPMNSRIYVYIIPYEKNNKVENRLVLYIDYNGAENEDYSRQIYSHIKESIRLEEDDGIINFTTDVNQLTTNLNATLRETGKSLEKKIKKSH